MDMLNWAKNEIDIACAPKDDGDSHGYYKLCCDSALKAFESLLNDGHSGYSIGVTKNILVRLIEGKPLTAIEDVPEAWNEVTRNGRGGSHEYQCKRMSSLFKYVYPDGRIEYSDIDRVICANINSPDVCFTTRIARDIIDAMAPITMPYWPKSRPYKVCMEDFLVDPKYGDYDTQGVLYAVDPDGNWISIDRYFAETDHGFEEITEDEYYERKAKAK